jgi:hypothetical protein
VYCALKIVRIARCAVKNLRRSVEEEGTKRRTKARRSKAHAQTPREMGSGFSSLTYPAKKSPCCSLKHDKPCWLSSCVIVVIVVLLDTTSLMMLAWLAAAERAHEKGPSCNKHLPQVQYVPTRFGVAAQGALLRVVSKTREWAKW